ncbi:MAG: hypothetical protein L0Y50_07575, partial [Beijerinckiaceae bacterium]|nr:hypothetical protein [Beijerinckiaceae bacterium]
MTWRRNQPMFGPGPAGRSKHIRDSHARPGSIHWQQGDVAIRRPMKAPPVPQKDGPRINREIRVREVQLIDADGRNCGAVEINEA